MRKKHSAEFMAKVSLSSLKGDQTMGQLSSKYEVHPTQIARWRKQALEGLVETFRNKPAQVDADIVTKKGEGSKS